MRDSAERMTAVSLSPPSVPRLRLEPTGSLSTLLDGGWWPRSNDPVAELPGLVHAIDGRHGPVKRIMLRRSEWSAHPRRLGAGGPDGNRVVRLGWFDTMPTGLLTAICTGERRVDLLVVPPQAGRAEAEAAMDLAAAPENRTRTPGLLASITAGPGPTRRAA